MGLRIIYGKSGSGKSTFCFKEIANLINTEKKIFIITPEQFSFTAEKKLLDEVGNSVINAEVITLSRMAYRVLQEIGEAKKQKLTKCGKAMLIFSILGDNKKDFKFLNKTDENIEIAIKEITEFKKHGITIEDLEKEKENLDDEYLKTKLSDMILVYKNFEESLRGEYIEENDLLDILAQNIEETDFIRDSIIYIDEFSGFTYQEYKILKEFIRIAKQVTLTITTDNLDKETDPGTDIFYSNKVTLGKILNLVDENNLKLEKPIFLEGTKRFKTDELEHLEKNIFAPRYKKYEKEVSNIHLFLAKNQYSEIENVAKRIIKLVKENNLRYRDISVITEDLDVYSNLIRAIFNEYNIPVFIDEKRDLNQNIIVQYVLSIFEIYSKNYSKDSVFNYLKLGFSKLEENDIFKLENYCTKWGIKQNKWKKDFTFGITDETKEKINYLNELRKEIINPLEELKSKFGNVEETCKAVYMFLKEQNIEEKINIKIQNLNDLGLLDLAKEYEESYKIILNIFDEMCLIFGKDKLSMDKFIGILKIGLKNSELGKIPGTQDQVIVGDTERSRSHKVDVCFIIGLNDGSFPSVNRVEGFFGDKDREILKQDGIEIANGTIDNLYEENFNIYKAFSTAEKEIYLSYASSETDGKSLRPSMIVNKIKRIYPKLIEKSDIIEKTYYITNKQKTYEELLENIASLKDNKKIDDIWYLVYEYYKKDNEYKEKLEKDLEAIDYTNLPKNINKELINKLYGNTLKTSVSKLEKYASCPFSYYLKYGLNLKEKEELKVQSFDTGSFLHEIIDEFFKEVKRQDIKLVSFLEDESKINIFVSKIIENKLDFGRKYSFSATTKYKVLVKRLERIITRALKYIIEGLVNSDFNIEGTEIEFDENGKYRPIQIEITESGRKIEIIGKIDRIDTAQDEDGKYLRIIDYKSSAKDIDLNEVYAGLQLQLLTYMNAVVKEEDLMPAGVLYFDMLDKIVSKNNRISDEEIEDEIRKSFQMKGLIVADVKLIKMQDHTLKTGSSKIIPASLNKDGEINKSWTKGVSKDEFKILQDYIYKTIKQIAKEILSGNVDIKPYNKNGDTPCNFCPYKTICMFDTRLTGNKYNYIPKKSRDDVIKKIIEESK